MTRLAPPSPAFIDGRDLGRRVVAQMLEAAARDRASADMAAQTDLDADLDLLDVSDDSGQDMAPSKAASPPRDPEQVRDMLHALQLCALFDCADDLTGLCEPGTTTQIILPPDIGPRLLALRLPAILQAIDAALGGALPSLRQVAAIAGRAPQPHETAGRPRSEWDLHEGLRNAIRGHHPVLLLLPPDVDPGPLAEVTCRVRLILPPVDGAMLTDLAAALYPETSEPPALPDDAALASLPAEVLIGAFGADSAAGAAAALGLPLPERVMLRGEWASPAPQAAEVLTFERALDHLTHLMAGRAAERYVFGTPSSLSGLGEGSDLDTATDLVLKLDCHWGLGDAGLLHTPIPRSHRHALPNWLRAKIDGLLREAEDDALTLLRIHGHTLRAISGRLLEERMVEREEVAGLLDVTKERDDQPQGANVVLLQRPG